MADSRPSHADEAAMLAEYADVLATGRPLSAEQFAETKGHCTPEFVSLLQTLEVVNPSAGDVLLDSGTKRRLLTRVRTRILEERELSVRRELAEGGQDARPISCARDCILVLLRLAGQVWGKTRLAKYVFLMKQETDCDVLVRNFYEHLAFRYGPFSKEVEGDIRALEAIGLVTVEKPADRNLHGSGAAGRAPKRKVKAIYALTERGENTADALMAEARARGLPLRRQVHEMIDRFRGKPLDDLVKYVYHKYPRFAENSWIKDDINGLYGL